LFAFPAKIGKKVGKFYWILDGGFWILDTGFWILDFWMLDVGCWNLEFILNRVILLGIKLFYRYFLKTSKTYFL